MQDQDLTTRLGNHAITCEQCAAGHRKEAEGIRAKPKTGWDQYDEADEGKAREHDKTAKRYDIRAGYAKKGLMADHVHDQADAEGFEYRQQHAELHAHAKSEGRSVALDLDNHEV